MNRRGHLSSKVPNVKLRPARGGSTFKRKEPSPMNEDDEEVLRQAWEGAEDDETSSTALRSSSRPWESVVITFTGVENKAELANMAKQLGASIESALTVTVTHVVASGFSSAKYLVDRFSWVRVDAPEAPELNLQYAVEHRIPVMQPGWIEATHSMYLAGEEFGLEDSVVGFKLPPFMGLTIAMSGIEPIERRRQLVHYITSNGGTYSKDLDRECTHLVSAKMTTERNQSEKVKWAMSELANRAGSKRAGKKAEGAEIWIVFEEWIWDCVGYEGRWKEDMYDARKVRRTPRCLADDVLNNRISKPVVMPAVVLENKEEVAVLKKRKKEAYDSVIKDLVAAAEPSAAAPKPTKSIESADTTERPGRRKTGQEVEERKSLLHVSKGNSFAAPHAPGSSTGAGTLAAAQAEKDMSAKQAADAQVKGEKKEKKVYPQIYTGLKIVPYIAEMPSKDLDNALRVHGAEVVSVKEWREGVKADYIVVRLFSQQKPDFSDIPVDERPQVVTECWVEGCCYEHRFIPPDSHIVFRPLRIQLPIPGSEKIIVHTTGFSIEAGVYMKRLIKAFGMTQTIKLNKQTTHLIAAVPKGLKYDKALEWGTHVVKESWLYKMAETGRLEYEGDHPLPAPVEAQAEDAGQDAGGALGGMDVDEPSRPVDQSVQLEKPEVLVAQTSGVSAPPFAATSAPPTGHASQKEAKKEKDRIKVEQEQEKENVDTSMSRSASRTTGDTDRSSRSQSQRGARTRDAKTPTMEASVAMANVLSPTRASSQRLNGAQVDEGLSIRVESQRHTALPDRKKEGLTSSIPSSNLKPSVSALQRLGLESPSRSIGRTVSAPDDSPSLSRKRGQKGLETEVSRSASVSAVPVPATSTSNASGLAASNKAPEVSDIMRLLVDPDTSTDTTSDKGEGQTSSAIVSNAVNKMIRRGRPSARLRNTTGSGVLSTPRSGDVSMADTTADTTHMFTPSPTGSRTADWTGSRREMSGTPGLGDGDHEMEDVNLPSRIGVKSGMGMAGMGMGMSMGFGAADMAEESVRVDYVDPAAEREKRRMMEAFKRAERDKAKRGANGF